MEQGIGLSLEVVKPGEDGAGGVVGGRGELVDSKAAVLPEEEIGKSAANIDTQGEIGHSRGSVAGGGADVEIRDVGRCPCEVMALPLGKGRVITYGKT